MGCLKQLRAWAEKKKVDPQKILCIFEDDDDDQGQMISVARNDGFNAIPQSKADIRAFDSCDLAAWKTKAVLDDSLYRELARDEITKKRIYASLNQLERIMPEPKVFTLEAMQGMCRRAHLKKRPVTEGQPKQPSLRTSR